MNKHHILWLIAVCVTWTAVGLIWATAPPPAPTLTTGSGTYTEDQFRGRVTAEIERYGFRTICAGHVQHLGQSAIPLHDFDANAFRALAFYAAACADAAERGEE